MVFLSINDKYTDFVMHFSYKKGGLANTSQVAYSSIIALCIYGVYVKYILMFNMHVCLCVCLCACVHACVPACMCVCVCVCVSSECILF